MFNSKLFLPLHKSNNKLMTNLKELPKKRGRKPIAKELKKEQSGLLKLNANQKATLLAIASGRGLTVSKMIEIDYNLNMKPNE